MGKIVDVFDKCIWLQGILKHRATQKKYTKVTIAKSFKLKISRVFFPSFQSCRSKNPSDFPNPMFSTLPLPPAAAQPSSSKLPHYSSLKRHVSTAFSSMGCGLRSRSSAQCFSETDCCNDSPPPPTPEFHWEREDRWHVITKVHDDGDTPRRKIYNISENEDDFSISPSKPLNMEMKRKRRYKKKKTTPSFDDEETETLVSSSGSFSADSFSEFNANLETTRETMPMRHGKRRKKNKKVKKSTTRNEMSESPARLLSILQWVVPCTVERKVRESFAVVKKSEDPYKDFKRSMMEMILEKQMFEDEDLEQLLHCFLALNSRHHHGTILQAFAEIWEALSSRRSTSVGVSCALN